MPLGGGMSGLGTNSFPGPTGSSSGGGKSSGAGQGGYGGAPSFGGTKGNPGPGGQQATAQTQPSFTQSPFPQTPFSSSVNTTTYPQQGMMGDDFGRGNRGGMPMQGGKSLGGVGPYGGAPGFGGMGTFSPVSQEQFSNSPLRNQWDSYEKYAQNGSGISGPGAPPPQQGGFGQFNAMNNMLRGQPANNLGQFGDPRSGFDSRNSFYTTGAPVAQVSQRMSTPEELEQQRLNPAPQLSPEDQQRMDSERNNLMNQVRSSPVTQRMFGGNQQYQDYLNQQGGMGAAANKRAMLGGFNPQAPDTSEQAYRERMALSNFAGGKAPTYDQWKQQQQQSKQLFDDQLAMFGGMGGQQVQQPRSSPFQQQFGGMGGGFGRMPQPQFNPFQQRSQFNQFQQQPVSPFQQQFGRFQQPRQQFGGFQQQQPQQQSQDMRGLAELLNLLRGRQG
jgi:hypothetical protein